MTFPYDDGSGLVHVPRPLEAGLRAEEGPHELELDARRALQLGGVVAARRLAMLALDGGRHRDGGEEDTSQVHQVPEMYLFHELSNRIFGRSSFNWFDTSFSC